MPFEKLDVKKYIDETLQNDDELKQMWDESRIEYQCVKQVIKLRKEKGLSQKELADKVGVKQQVISRVERNSNSPSLRTFCRIVNELGYEIEFREKPNNISTHHQQ